MKRKAAISWVIITIFVALCWLLGPGRKKQLAPAPPPAAARDASIGD